MVGFQGTVVACSFHQGEACGLYLGEEFPHNRIRIISSQACDVNPLLHPRWNHRRELEATMAILPRLKLDHLFTHEFPIEDAQEAFDLMDRHPEKTMQVVFAY